MGTKDNHKGNQQMQVGSCCSLISLLIMLYLIVHYALKKHCNIHVHVHKFGEFIAFLKKSQEKIRRKELSHVVFHILWVTVWKWFVIIFLSEIFPEYF